MRDWLATTVKRPSVIWVAFVAIHLWLAYVGLNHPTLPWGDVTLQYLPWALRALSGDVVGVSEPWVYPLLALVPMIAAMVLGSELYGVGWFLVVLVTNAVVLSFLLGRTGPSARIGDIRIVAAWWWLVFLLVLGPVSLGRIDVTTVAISIIALLLARRKPAIAGALLALATWIKVWPAVLIGVIVVAVHRRVTALIWFFAAAVSLGLIVVALGSGTNSLGFITQQSARGLQVEAPISTPWMWLALIDPASARVSYITSINTFQVIGVGVDATSVVMTPLLVVVSAAVLLLGALLIRRGVNSVQVLAPLSLAIVVGLLLFNKVGSPQFVLWLAAPIILGISTRGREFRLLAILALITAALTQLIYPFGYDALLASHPVMLVVLTLRNVLIAVIFSVAMRDLWRLRRPKTVLSSQRQDS